jgi:hypothetical protein
VVESVRQSTGVLDVLVGVCARSGLSVNSGVFTFIEGSWGRPGRTSQVSKTPQRIRGIGRLHHLNNSRYLIFVLEHPGGSSMLIFGLNFTGNHKDNLTMKEGHV